MPALNEPSSSNGYLDQHISMLLRCHLELTGRQLVPPNEDSVARARAVNEAPFFVASHDCSTDPVLSYGNRCALNLFAMKWQDFVQTPSRFTAEAPNRSERQRLLTTVAEQGFIDDYSGIRISAEGRRFRIFRATVWNLSNTAGEDLGQAATFSDWDFVD